MQGLVRWLSRFFGRAIHTSFVACEVRSFRLLVEERLRGGSTHRRVPVRIRRCIPTLPALEESYPGRLARKPVRSIRPVRRRRYLQADRFWILRALHLDSVIAGCLTRLENGRSRSSYWRTNRRSSARYARAADCSARAYRYPGGRQRLVRRHAKRIARALSARQIVDCSGQIQSGLAQSRRHTRSDGICRALRLGQLADLMHAVARGRDDQRSDARFTRALSNQGLSAATKKRLYRSLSS